jgi:ATP-dependent DNA helicase DinG
LASGWDTGPDLSPDAPRRDSFPHDPGVSEPRSDPRPPRTFARGVLATADVFRPGGRLASAHPAYERREGQEEMALAVEEALRGGKRLLIEAGTGVGKTLAYLVPAALSGKRVVVSTGTKNLQDQIVEKDLPFVVEKLGIPVTGTAVKGRDNYLCLRRFHDHDRDPLLPTIQEGEAYDRVRAWAPGTATGDRGEIEGLPEDASFWRRINARADTCTGQKCEDYEECWLTKVRRRASESQIVVVNHHLFFADLALREDAFGKVLPDYDAVVFDEAHQVEEVATLFFGVSCSSGRVLELADDAARVLGRGGVGGPRTGWAEANPGRGGPDGVGSGMEKDAGTPGGRRRRARRPRRRGLSGVGDNDILEAQALRVAVDGFFGPLALVQGRRPLAESLRDPGWTDRLEGLKTALEGVRSAVQEVSPVTDETVALERRCRELTGALETACRGDDEDYVYWSEVRGRSVTVSASPVDVARLLDETLFANVGAAVMTSATLSVGGDFSYVRDRTGIQGAEERIVPSPFDYRTQAVLYLPDAMPEPRSAAYNERMLREIESLIGISKGRAFLLFTSHAELRRVEESLHARTRHPILVQGSMPKARLLDEFRRRKGAVLLGAASFWHGVDVAGEALSLVVIDRIPFDVPSDPLVAARIARIRGLGGEPFEEYQVPAAAIELKQGLGRLIRNRSDRGILAVLDSRLRTRGYGKTLLASIPPFPIVHDIEEARRFFEDGAPVAR